VLVLWPDPRTTVQHLGLAPRADPLCGADPCRLLDPRPIEALVLTWAELGRAVGQPARQLCGVCALELTRRAERVVRCPTCARDGWRLLDVRCQELGGPGDD